MTSFFLQGENIDSKIERNELFCHECRNYVQFDIDVSLNGNHIIKCPKCGHEHCRVVKNGIITDIRLDSRNGNIPPYIHPTVFNTNNVTSSATSTYDNYVSISATSADTSIFTYQMWMNLSSGS